MKRKGESGRLFMSPYLGEEWGITMLLEDSPRMAGDSSGEEVETARATDETTV